MSCTTCGHTLEGIGHRKFHRFFYCHRCGTLVEEHRSDEAGPSQEWRLLSVAVPKLVGRCRSFEAWCKEGIGWTDTNVFKQWTGIGIAESVNTPDNRPEPPTPSTPDPESWRSAPWPVPPGTDTTGWTVSQQLGEQPPPEHLACPLCGKLSEGGHEHPECIAKYAAERQQKG
jgi:hypothetical protein